jgi:choline kinase
MQLIILGAGRGSRLGAANGGLPKPLLQVQGKTLLERQLALAEQVFPEIDHVSIVVGFRADVVRESVPLGVHCVENPDFVTTNTAASVYVALSNRLTDSLLLNGDVFFDREALERARSVTNGAVCEFKDMVDPEEVQVTVGRSSEIQRIVKNIGGVAEAVGIYRISTGFATTFVQAYLPRDRVRYYEDVFDRLLLRGFGPFIAAGLEGAIAVEIDTPADLDRVENLYVGV